jgi:hypothetical protein
MSGYHWQCSTFAVSPHWKAGSLVHGEQDTGRQAGRRYFMLAGTDGQVHYVYYTPELEAARSKGWLRTN